MAMTASQSSWIRWVLLAGNLVLISSIYVEEPLLYDTFPTGFKWAAATSAYQIEGGWDADGKGLSIWDKFTQNSSLIADGSNGQVACDSYHLYQRDVEMLKSLGVTHYRFSLSWSRILPQGIGRVNEAGVNYYKNLIAALKQSGIEPLVTLFHADLPQALEDMNGWLNVSSQDWFKEYAGVCFSAFGNDVKLWVTFNEPQAIADSGYESGNSAPGRHGPGILLYQVGHNILLAHAKAYRLYESSFKPTQKGRVAIVLNFPGYVPKDGQAANFQAAERGIQFSGGWFANPIFGSGDYPEIMKINIAKKSQLQGFNQSRLPEFTDEEKAMLKGSSDFFGVNYYSSNLAEDAPSDNSQVSYWADQDIRSSQDPTWYGSASSWLKVTPFGMRDTLQWIKKSYGNQEIVVTENGFSDYAGNLDDLQRVYYLKHNINAVLKAIKLDAINVTGYIAWSLMDNFEWTMGYTHKFGLFSVDFNSPNRTRTAKSSARFYTQVIRDNGFTTNLPCE